jgi:hypothetical protein
LRSQLSVTKRLKTAERFARLSIDLKIVPAELNVEDVELQEDLSKDMAVEE